MLDRISDLSIVKILEKSNYQKANKNKWMSAFSEVYSLSKKYWTNTTMQVYYNKIFNVLMIVWESDREQPFPMLVLWFRRGALDS